MTRLTKAEEYRESFTALEEGDLLIVLESESSKDLLYSLRALYRKKDLAEIGFSKIKKVAERGPTAGVRRMAMNVINKFYRDRIGEVDIEGKVRSGWVYFFLNEDSGLVKIGFTTNLKKRLERLSKKEGIDLVVLNCVKSSNYSQLERHYHRRFASTAVGREWFRLSEDDVRMIVSGVF